MPLEEIGSLLWALLVTCLILVLAYWFTRRVVGRTALGGRWKGRHLTVLEQITVGKEQKLLLVRMGERLYFLAVTPGGVTILRELSEEEAAPWMTQDPQTTSGSDSFVQALRRVLEQRKR